MPERKTIQIPLGGMHSAGNAGRMPDNATRLMENVLWKPGRWEKRPPFVSDSVSTCFGLAIWDDHDNYVQRLVAFQDNGSNIDLRVKGTSGETYAAAVTGTTGNGMISAFTNYRGILYYCVTSNPYGRTPPNGIFSYNGTAVAANPIGGEALYSLTINAFIDRLFLGYVRASTENKLGTTTAYDSTDWTATTVTAANITNGSTVTSRIIPTNTTTSKIEKANVYTVAASTTDTNLVFRSDLRNTSSSYEMPMTQEIYYSQTWAAATTYAVGAVRVATSSASAGAQLLRFRVSSVAGTALSHATTEPTWPTTVGGTVVDNEVTWIADGKKEIASQPFTLPTLTETGEFLAYWCRATVPPMPASAGVGVRLKFGTPAVGTIELHGVDISLKDGKDDGDRTKENRGQQLTIGRFFYPFFNQEDSATATIDLDNDIYWTETADPNAIRGSNYQKLRDAPGKVTAAAVAGNRYIVFKRRGMWVFQGTGDPDIPLQREAFFGRIGCIGPRAWAVHDGKLYFVAEDDVYEYAPGGEPVPICGDGMREEIMNKTPGLWIDAGAAGVRNIVSVGIDPTARDIYITTQTRYTHIFNLEKRVWSRIRTQDSSNNAVQATYWTWNPNTQQMYAVVSTNEVSGTGGIYRLDKSSSGDDDDMGAILSYVTLRPIETFFPRREFSVDAIGLYHATTGAQTNNTFEVQAALDGGTSFAKYNRITIPTTASSSVTVRTAVPLRQLGQNVIIRLYHSGDGGGTMFNVSDVDVDVRDLGPQRNLSTPTQGAASL